VAKTDPDTRASGSHYLDPDGPIVRKLVEAAALKPGETVLDAGSGMGAITGAVCAAVAPTGNVLAVEQKPELVERLRDEGLPGLRAMHGDVLKVNLPEPLHAVVANPPYRILPALLRRLLDHGFGRAVLVVPKELAERLSAPVKSEAYGKLSVTVGARAKVELLFPVPRKAFDPPPAVPSAVLRIRPKPAEATAGLDLEMLDTVVEAAWDGRKRTLRHALSPLAEELGLPPQDITDAIAAVKGAERRFADVSPWEYTVLARHLAACVESRAGQAKEKAAREAVQAQKARKERRRERRRLQESKEAEGDREKVGEVDGTDGADDAS
jgi:16S rRNA (adenine1518-N6/adenine1519-N6)-dimethyltransferase